MSTKILEHKGFELDGSEAAVAFGNASTGVERAEQRVLFLDGKPAFGISMGCGTCGYLLERLPGASRTVSIDAARDALNEGIATIDDEVVELFGHLVPPGEYEVVLAEITPTLVAPGDANDYFSHEQMATWGGDGLWGLPHWPAMRYYRLGTTPFVWDAETRRTSASWNSALFEFVVPMIPTMWLRGERVDEYRQLLREDARPTAVALSIIDNEKWAVPLTGDPALDAHWIWTHFLLDGHHKIYAAAAEGRPITLLSLVCLEAGLSFGEHPQQDVERALKIIGAAADLG